MRKINIPSLFLFALFFALSATCLFLVNAVNKKDLAIKLSRNFVSEEAICFSSDHPENLLAGLSGFCRQTDQKKYSIMTFDQENKLGAVYQKGADIPPLRSGRYFTAEDYFCEKRVAVVGQNHTKEIFEEHGKQYIQTVNGTYEVIGIMGYQDISTIDSFIFVNLDSLSAGAPSGYSKFFLDSTQAPDKIFAGLKQSLESQGITITQKSNEKRGVSLLFTDMLKNTSLYLLAILCYVLCSVTVSHEWILSHKKAIAVKRLLGVPTQILAREILFSYLFLTVLGIICGILFSFVFDEVNTDFKVLTVSSICSILLGILLSIPSIRGMFKIPVAEAVKQ